MNYEKTKKGPFFVKHPCMLIALSVNSVFIVHGVLCKRCFILAVFATIPKSALMNISPSWMKNVRRLVIGFLMSSGKNYQK